MKKLLFTLLAPSVMLTTASAGIVSKTFTGVTTYNKVEAGPITSAFPVGTPWTVTVEWDDAVPYKSLTATQASYPLTKFTVSLEGTNGTWTTSSLPNKASFSLNQYGGQHEIQFTSGWGPANHTNMVIENWQPFSINLSLEDPSGTAIPALGMAPTGIDLAAWKESEFKIYLNNDGDRGIYGSIDPSSSKDDSSSENSSYDDSSSDDDDIKVKLPGGREIEEGETVANFGRAKIGKSGRVTKFKISNTSSSPLKKIRVSLTGSAKRDFAIVQRPSAKLAAGKSMTFKARFKPRKKGTRSAAIRVSTYGDEKKNFYIPMSGKGL